MSPGIFHLICACPTFCGVFVQTLKLSLASGASLWPSSAQPSFPSHKALTIRLHLPELGWLSPRYNAVCLYWLNPVHDVSHLSMQVETVGDAASLLGIPSASFTRNYSFLSFPLYTYVRAKSLQSCLTLCDPKDCSPPGSSAHGILQVRRLE